MISRKMVKHILGMAFFQTVLVLSLTFMFKDDHTTLVFGSLGLMMMFNLLASRKVNDEMNCFNRIQPGFLIIWILILAV
jgi:hypothetical protein